MPGGMSGIDLAQHASARMPKLKILLTSGFPDTRFGDDPSRALAWRLLSKPYRKEELARAVRETLDGLERQGHGTGAPPGVPLPADPEY